MSIFYRTAAEDLAILRDEGKTPPDGLRNGQTGGGNVVIPSRPGADTSAIPCPSHVRDGSRAPYVPAN